MDFRRFLPKDIYGNDITYSSVKEAFNQTEYAASVSERNYGNSKTLIIIGVSIVLLLIIGLTMYLMIKFYRRKLVEADLEDESHIAKAGAPGTKSISTFVAAGATID